ncbi:hypothetical protein V8D89_003982 [Ganoderma adspersum]
MSSDLVSSSLLPRLIHPFSLVIPPTTYCPGSDVEGEVLLKFPQMQDEQMDEVVVEFEGRVKVITENTTEQELVSVKQSLWKRGSAYPPPGSHILRVPFRFHLPSDPKIVPSVFWNEWHHFVSIVYYVEVSALRSKTFFADDKKIRERLVVVSRGDPILCAHIRSLNELDGGPTWKAAHTEQPMRRGLWGEYSTARVEVLVPNAHGILPHCVDIPVHITIKTTTARISRASADRHLAGKPIFPTIAFDSNTGPISINMRQNFTVRVPGDTSTLANKSVLAHIKEEDLLPSSYYKHWEPDTRFGDRQEMGRWVQHWTVQPTVQLHRFPPTFSSELVDCAYVMSVQVPFPGMGNDVRVTIPITLDSGIDQATPRRAGRAAGQLQGAATSSGAGADASSDGWDGVPPEEPLPPPTYLDAVGYHNGGMPVASNDGRLGEPEGQSARR